MIKSKDHPSRKNAFILTSTNHEKSAWIKGFRTYEGTPYWILAYDGGGKSKEGLRSYQEGIDHLKAKGW